MSIRACPPVPICVFRKGTSREPRSFPAPRNRQRRPQNMDTRDGDQNA